METVVAITSGGRVNQKQRTRNALVEVAARFVHEGRTFTVADVADEAMIGRTTAYRYFPKLESLIAHASLYAITNLEQKGVAQALEAMDSSERRLVALVDASDRSAEEHGHLYRTMLRMSLNAGSDEMLPRRSGIRRVALDSAIGSLRPRLGEAGYERLVAALSLFMGIESVIVLQDVCLLEPAQARHVKLWGARALLEVALAEADAHAAAKVQKAARPDNGLGSANA